MISGKVFGELKGFNLDEVTDDALDAVTSEVASAIHERTASEINNITWETFRGIEIENIGGPQHEKNVVSTVPWSLKLEFHGHPFMRPAAIFVKRKISKIIKMVIGPYFKGKTSLKHGK